MRFSLLFTFLFFLGAVNAQYYTRLHHSSIVADSHNDIISATIENGYLFDSDLRGETYSDLDRMMRSVNVQVFSVWCDGNTPQPFRWANREIDSLDAWIKRNPAKMMLVTNKASLAQALKEKKLACMIGVEGGHMIENDISKLDSLYKRGARYLTLTWNNSTPWSTSAMDETQHPDSLLHKGLTDFGKAIVHHMNDIGMMIDLSHTGEQTFWDVINNTTKPVLISHSCVYAICPVFRNLKDDQIKAIGKNNGVIDINFYSAFVDSSFAAKNAAFMAEHKAEYDSLIKTGKQDFFSELYLYNKYSSESNALRPALSKLIDHIDYIVKLIGVDHVGLGSDFDGITSAPLGLDEITDLPLVTKALLQRGYSKEDIRKILGENFIRVFKANMVN